MTDAQVAQNLLKAMKLFNEALVAAAKRDIIAELTVSDLEILELANIGASGGVTRYDRMIGNAPQVRVNLISKIIWPKG